MGLRWGGREGKKGEGEGGWLWGRARMELKGVENGVRKRSEGIEGVKRK